MDRKLRKRIIGAVVLGAFLVILVPEWLDGAGHKSRYGHDITIPEKPEFQPINNYMKDSKQSRNNPAIINKRIKSEESLIHAWALQLGSFTLEKNAEMMRDKLRAKGYPSYVDVSKKTNETIYRVRIGPELDKQHLEKLKSDVFKKENIKGMIVRHP